MPRLLRYRLVNVGDAAATYPDVLFEPEGDSFCIIQPNGTGKSTAVKFLLHALVNGRYVDQGSRRKLEEYLVPEGRVAHVVLEFGEPVAVPRGSERRVLVGLAVDRRRQENRKLHYLITFGPQHAVRWAERGIGLDASTLPLVDTRRSVTEQGELQVWSPRSLERLYLLSISGATRKTSLVSIRPSLILFTRTTGIPSVVLEPGWTIP